MKKVRIDYSKNIFSRKMQYYFQKQIRNGIKRCLFGEND